MNEIEHTRHSSTRLQQRGISNLAVQLLLSYGSAEMQRANECYRYLSKRDFNRLERDLKRLDIDKLRDLFAVELPDGRLKTVGRQLRHHRRNAQTTGSCQ
jgi:hypothetical protein